MQPTGLAHVEFNTKDQNFYGPIAKKSGDLYVLIGYNGLPRLRTFGVFILAWFVGQLNLAHNIRLVYMSFIEEPLKKSFIEEKRCIYIPMKQTETGNNTVRFDLMYLKTRSNFPCGIYS